MRKISQNEIKFELRKQVSSGLITLGNTAAAALVFGQLLNKQNFNALLAFLGLFLLIFFYLFATFMFIGAKAK